MLDTSNILFIGAGSFAGIDEVVKRRINKTVRLGFGGEQKRRDLDDTQIYGSVKAVDVLEFGIIPELLGRMPVLTTTLPLTEEEMVRILTEPKNALVKQFRAIFAMNGIRLTFDTDALHAIGAAAKNDPKGARALRSILEDVLLQYMYELPGEAGVIGLHVSKAAVEGTAEATVTRAPRAATA